MAIEEQDLKGRCHSIYKIVVYRNHALRSFSVSRIMSSVQATDLDELDRKLGISGGGGSNRKLMTDITSHSEETMSDPVLSRARSNTPSEPLPESFEKVSEDTRPSSVGGGTGKVTFNLPHLGTSPSKVYRLLFFRFS